MTIALDMMGGDFAPLEPVKGILRYLAETPEPMQVAMLGHEDAVLPLLEQHNIDAARATMIHCAQVVGYHDHPVKALKEKQQSSIAVGFGMLAQGKVDAFISAGNTGAMLVGSMFSLKPMEQVLRPTIATIIPREDNRLGLLLDVGINSDCKPENLNQFATMGTAYAREILGIGNPTVGLLNIGEEEGKGNLLAQAAYPLLKANASINFLGNIEGRDVLDQSADVVVCDGFTGNIILKLLESVYTITHRQGIHHPYFNRFHFEQYGGTPILGIEKPVIIGHGVSGAEAFGNMLGLAQKMLATDFIGKMKGAL
jgi:glycerol-3-phosphate acyltransferase PlsX